MRVIAILGTILSIIILIIAFVLSIRIRVIISFKDGRLTAHKKILFLKLQAYPKAKKYKKKSKLKKTTDQIIDSEDPRQILKMIISLREFILKVLLDLLDKIKITVIKISASVGTKNATTTALVGSAFLQCAAYFVEFLDNYSNIELSDVSGIDIQPDFLSQKLQVQGELVFYIRVVNALFLRLDTLITLLKIDSIEEVLSEVINNGTIETK
ncbi:MAG: hypothetical protein E7622_01620 [Ruminococcaceae bacterium]|nr:hypothetical protein [Oscillospiraceae bacterium]